MSISFSFLMAFILVDSFLIGLQSLLLTIEEKAESGNNMQSACIRWDGAGPGPVGWCLFFGRLANKDHERYLSNNQLSL
jgi:hypothetical protein